MKVYVPLAKLSTVAGNQVPVIDSNDELAKTGAVAPEQIGAIAVKVGVVFGVTVTESVAVVAHNPAVGMKVYVPLVVLSTVAGDQVPVIDSKDELAKTGAVAPEQIGEIAVNVGVVFGVTVTESVAVVAHNPAVGVKVYVPLTKLSTVTGDQVPVIDSKDELAKTGAVAPEQIGAIAVKVGVVFGVTVTESVAVVAQSPAVGVKVYVPLVVLSTVAGDHVPVIDSNELDANTGAVAPEQIGAIAVNVGVVFGVTVTLKVVVVAQSPTVGVKV